MSWEVRLTAEFEQWLKSLQPKHEAQIRKRLTMLKLFGNLGDFKSLGEGLFELRWRNGTRVYFARTGARKVLILLGGMKNVQENQIKKARRLLG